MWLQRLIEGGLKVEISLVRPLRLGIAERAHQALGEDFGRFQAIGCLARLDVDEPEIRAFLGIGFAGNAHADGGAFVQSFGTARLAEWQKALLADTQIDKGGIQGRLDPAHPAAIDLALDHALAGFRPAVEVELDDAAILGDSGAGLADIFFDQDLPVHAEPPSPIRAVTG